MKTYSHGFTLIEIVVLFGMIAILFTITSVNLIGTEQKPELSGTMEKILVDLGQQQIKAMTGDTGGVGSTSNYGIYFSQNSYTMFRGSSYVSTDPLNYTVALDPSLQFVPITLPSGTIVFTKGSGEVVNFSGANDLVTVQNIRNGDKKTITINQYGVVIGVQ